MVDISTGPLMSDTKVSLVLWNDFSPNEGFCCYGERSTEEGCKISKQTLCFSRLFLYLSTVKLC